MTGRGGSGDRSGRPPTRRSRGAEGRLPVFESGQTTRDESPMTARAVDWHEGMFLRPHHFLAAQQYHSYQANLSQRWDLHYNWGLRAIQLNLEGLSNSRFVVLSLKARLRDGTLVAIPEDGVLPVLDLKPALVGRNDVTISLALPVLQPGKAN